MTSPTNSELLNLCRALPHDFQWGAATSAAQIEGAYTTDGKGLTIWDRFCEEPGRINDASDIRIACDHYHLYKEDIGLMQGLGLDAYRFSVAWARVQPDGKGEWNEAGFAFYERLLDSLQKAGIRPHVTLYHWDLPLALQEDFGGWESRKIVPLFAKYAAEVARRFGDRVASIATLNEPWCVATLGYEVAQFAPGKKDRAMAMQVSHHLMMAHGAAVKAMREVSKVSLGVVLNHTPAYAAEPLEADRQAARIDDGLNVRWYMDPIFRGQYPADVIHHLGADAPKMEAADLSLICQPLDFLGINFYTRSFISTQQPPKPAPGKQGFTDMGWEIYPEALTQHLVRISREYSPPPIFITENGMANADSLVGGEIKDVERVKYVNDHVAAVARAVSLGVNVRGYFYWSLLDNFEWNSGYTKRFGIFYVDYATQKRVAKDSALWYRDFIAAFKAGKSAATST